MTLSLVGSFSADSISFGVAFLWIAQVLRFVEVEEKPAARWRREALELCAVAVLLGLTKFFFPLPLLAFIVFFSPGKARRATVAVCLGAMAVSLVSSLIWLKVSGSVTDATRLDIPAQPALQMAFVCQHPLQFLEICFRTLQFSFFVYWVQIVGVLGWLQIVLPLWLYAGMWIALFVSVGFEGLTTGKRFTGGARLYCGLLAIAIFFSVCLAIYGKWNAIGAPMIQGVQGRYFIVMLPLIGLATMCPLWPRLGMTNGMRTFIYGFALLANGWALYTQCQYAFLGEP